MDFQWLRAFGPGWGIAMVIAAYLALLAWALTRPADVLRRGAPDRKTWRDLRWWILPIVLVQIWLHWIFR